MSGTSWRKCYFPPAGSSEGNTFRIFHSPKSKTWFGRKFTILYSLYSLINSVSTHESKFRCFTLFWESSWDSELQTKRLQGVCRNLIWTLSVFVYMILQMFHTVFKTQHLLQVLHNAFTMTRQYFPNIFFVYKSIS